MFVGRDSNVYWWYAQGMNGWMCMNEEGSGWCGSMNQCAPSNGAGLRLPHSHAQLTPRVVQYNTHNLSTAEMNCRNWRVTYIFKNNIPNAS